MQPPLRLLDPGWWESTTPWCLGKVSSVHGESRHQMHRSLGVFSRGRPLTLRILGRSYMVQRLPRWSHPVQRPGRPTVAAGCDTTLSPSLLSRPCVLVEQIRGSRTLGWAVATATSKVRIPMSFSPLFEIMSLHRIQFYIRAGVQAWSMQSAQTARTLQVAALG